MHSNPKCSCDQALSLRDELANVRAELERDVENLRAVCRAKEAAE